MANKNKSVNDPVQHIIGQIIWGFVVRILIVIAFAVSVGKLLPFLGDKMGFTVPGWSKPVLIIFAIILGIAAVIKYAIRVFNILKNGYLNMEQMAAQAAAQGIESYTEYPQYTNYQTAPMYQQNYNQPIQQTDAVDPTPEKKKGRGCIKIFMFVFLTFILGSAEFAFISSYVDYLKVEETYEIADATVTEVTSYETTSQDEDGIVETETHYNAKYSYTYKGKEYIDSKNNTKHYSEDEVIVIYVDPNNPKNTVIKWSEGEKKSTLVWSIVLPVIWLLIVFMMSGGKKK